MKLPDKKNLKWIFITILFQLFFMASANEIDTPKPEKVVILTPMDSSINELPVLKEMSKDEPVAKMVYQLFQDSYMGESVSLYYMAQHFLLKQNKIQKLEPAYLLLSQNQGGFPQMGFYLLKDDSLIDKSTVPFIELVKNNTNSEDYLGSMTQIYPHEMGHVIYKMLSTETDSIVPASTDVHYSTLATDYRTGFNEGFAMHSENMARLYDPSPDRRNAIVEDLKEKKKFIRHKIKGYSHDFTWPLRMGLYRIAMITWYQNFEDIKRYEWVMNNLIRYGNHQVLFNNPEKSLFYRNSGISHTINLRVPQRAFATEGVIASFFMALMQSESVDYIQDYEFQTKFNPPSADSVSLIKKINPLQNQYRKIFYILHNYLNTNLTTKSQFIDFIDGYLEQFPEESEIVGTVFRNTTGYTYPIDPGPELWISNENHQHGILVMEQFGGITLPLYTFNLNAATEADFLTFENISQDQSKTIVSAIQDRGYLSRYDDLYTIPGLPEEIAEMLVSHAFHPDHLRKIEEEAVLSLDGLIYSNLRQLMIMGGAYLALSLLFGLLILKWLQKKGEFRIMLKIFLRFLFFLLLALVVVVVTHFPIVYFLGCSAIIMGITALLLRNPHRRKQLMLTTIPLVLLIAYTII